MIRSKVFAFLLLFTSFGTLICCAIPALLVALGLGAVLAATVSAVPGLIFLSEHKEWVFLIAGVLLVLAAFFRIKARKQICPIDSNLGAACRDTREISSFVFWSSTVLYVVGALFAFVLPGLI